jgi:hypothetical protein
VFAACADVIVTLMITSATDLLLTSTMPGFQLNYYIFGDDTDFCFPLTVYPRDSIMHVGRTIQKKYSEDTGIKLVFLKLFKIDQSQDKMNDIVAPTAKCMRLSKLVEDYWTGAIDKDLVHILVIAGRK